MDYIQACEEIGVKLNEPFVIDNEIGEQTYKFGNNCLLVGCRNKSGDLKWAYAYDQLDYVLACKDSIVKGLGSLKKEKGRPKGANPFSKRKKTADDYKNTTIRWKKQEYQEMISKCLSIHGAEYSSFTDYVKSLIKKD